MSKKELLRKLNATYCRIGRSKLNGVGVIAIRDMPRGTDPFIGCLPTRWVKLTVAEVARLPTAVQTMVRDFYV